MLQIKGQIPTQPSGHGPFMNESNSESQAMTRLVTTEEREQAVKLLTTAFAEDAIPVAEFERRVAEVYRAEDAKALELITRDLPTGPDQSDTAEPATVPATIDRSSAIARRPDQKLKSVLSSIERRIDGPMPGCLDVRTVMGSMELDLRRAEFPRGVTEIRVKAVLGNIEIELPDHVRVEHEGHALLAVFSVRGRSPRRESDDTPVVRITGRSILANVEVELDD